MEVGWEQTRPPHGCSMTKTIDRCRERGGQTKGIGKRLQPELTTGENDGGGAFVIFVFVVPRAGGRENFSPPL